MVINIYSQDSSQLWLRPLLRCSGIGAQQQFQPNTNDGSFLDHKLPDRVYKHSDRTGDIDARDRRYRGGGRCAIDLGIMEER